MTPYIFDSHGLAALGDAAQALGVPLDDVLAAMTELLEQGHIQCPPLVLRDCRSLGDVGDKALTWARTAAAHFTGCSVSYAVIDEVVNACPGLVDFEDSEENAQVEVLALAIVRRRQGSDPTVVSAQIVDTPLGMSIASAAAIVGVPFLTPAEFVTSLALPSVR